MKKIIIYYLAVGFILNLIWEMLQSGLYAPHFEGNADFIFVHLRATIGDVVMLFIIFAILSLFYGRWNWIKERKISPYAIVALLGFVLAAAVEKYALATGRWAYDGSMPMVPIFEAGITPLLQLTIIAPFSLFLAKRYASKGSDKKR